MLSNKKVTDGIWGCCTPTGRLPRTVGCIPSAVAWRGRNWTASIWAESGGFWEGPFSASWKLRRWQVFCNIPCKNGQAADGCGLLWWTTGWLNGKRCRVGLQWAGLHDCWWRWRKEWGRCAESKAGFICSVWWEKILSNETFISLLWLHEFGRIKTINKLSRPKKLTQSYTRQSC